MARVFQLPDRYTIGPADQELLGNKSTWILTGSAYKCATCGTTQPIPEMPTTLVCQTCESHALRVAQAGGGGNGGVIRIGGGLPIGTPLKLAPPIQVPVRDVEMKFVSGPVTFVDSGCVTTIDATVDGLDRYTCWVRWSQNRNSIEGRRGHAIHPLTDAQIAAGKLYQSNLWAREREMNGPPRPSKPKLTILVDQDIED